MMRKLAGLTLFMITLSGYAADEKYFVVLRPEAKDDLADSVITEVGGRVLKRSTDRRVVMLPKGLARQLVANDKVLYMQRIWQGEPKTDFTDLKSGWRLEAATTATETVDGEGKVHWNSGTIAYDGSGNIKIMGDDVYAYDAAGRLVRATVGGITETYTYDSFGNLIEKTSSGAGVAAVPPVDPSSNRVSGFVYDIAGNVTYDGTPGYAYDAVNMLVWQKTNLGQEKRYIYTADDERLGFEFVGFGWLGRWTVRDFSGRVLTEYAGAAPAEWEWKEDYIYREGQLVASETQPVTGVVPPYGGRRHMHVDHLGTPRVITDANGVKLARHDYYPFGVEQTFHGQEVLNTVQARPQPKAFTGHQRDFNGLWNYPNDDYLDYMHARYYNPQLGRFLSVDPVLDVKTAMRNPQAWNRYAYVMNNPVRFTDPTGKYTCEGTKDQCKAFEAGLNIVRAAANEATRTRQPGAAALNSVVALFGKAGVKNNVSVVVKASGIPGATGTADTIGKKTTLTVETAFINNVLTTGRGYVNLAKTAAHEGDHAVQMLANRSLQTSISFQDILFLERSAWRSETYINSTLGISDSVGGGIWQVGVGWNPAILESTAHANAVASCNTTPGGCTP